MQRSRVLLAAVVAHAPCAVGCSEPVETTSTPPIVRDPAFWPFSADSPWNTPLGSNAVYEPETSELWDSTGGAALSTTDWSHPVFIASASDPLRTIYHADGIACATIRIPMDAAPDPESDAHMHVIDERHLAVVETWGCVDRGDGSFEAGACVTNDLKDQGVYGDWHGVRAYGGSALGGLIRAGEVTTGIPHALAVAGPAGALNRFGPNGTGWVWPASSADDGWETNYGTTGNVFMGSLLAIPPAVDLEAMALSPAGLAIGRALQDYGAYMTDSGGGDTIIGFYAEPGAAPELGGDLWGDLQALVAELHVVTNNAEATPGGGGEPRRPQAPPFDR